LLSAFSTDFSLSSISTGVLGFTASSTSSTGFIIGSSSECSSINFSLSSAGITFTGTSTLSSNGFKIMVSLSEGSSSSYVFIEALVFKVSSTS